MNGWELKGKGGTRGWSRLVNGSRERGVGGYIHAAQMSKAWWREWIDIIRFCSMGERAGELANDKSPDTTNTL